jgi:hypothetical protein
MLKTFRPSLANIHSSVFSGGEVRGFLEARASVSEAGTALPGGAAVAGLGFLRGQRVPR